MGINNISQDYGQPLSEKVGLAFKNLLQKIPSREEMDKMKEEMKTPENIKELGAPKVNPELWQNLPRRAQTNDAAQQHIQQAVGRSLTAQAKVAQLLSENSNKIPQELLKELLKNVMDGAMQTAFVHREISSKRRQAIKPFLAQDCVGICGSTVPVTEFLFGNNLEKDLSLAKSSSKILKSATPFHRPQNNYQSSSSNFTPRGNYQRLNYQRPPFQRVRGQMRGGRFQARGQFNPRFQR